MAFSRFASVSMRRTSHGVAPPHTTLQTREFAYRPPSRICAVPSIPPTAQGCSNVFMIPLDLMPQSELASPGILPSPFSTEYFVAAQ